MPPERLRLSDLAPERLKDRRVVVRADLNVPLDEHGEITDETRILATLPTLVLLLDAGARVTLVSHLGRPSGPDDDALSLAPVAERIRALLDRPVSFVRDSPLAPTDETAEPPAPGTLRVLENLRFEPGETRADPELARALADCADLYVNDAFGAAHRRHASTAVAPEMVRERGGRAVLGLLFEREVAFLTDALDDPERPYVAVLGGAKISGKIDVIEAILPRVDRLLVGGAMANTFFQALGLDVGHSLVEPDRVETAREVLSAAGDRLVLPVDCVVAPEIDAAAEPDVVERTAVAPGNRIGDVGPVTRSVFDELLRSARTVLWNGPMGVFELEAFRHGTLSVARSIAAATEAGALSVVGGGDSAAALRACDLEDRVSHVSTGGGAALELLAGRTLPGLDALSPA